MSARILALLELADEVPEPEELVEFLTDPEPEVRRTALTVLSEATEDWSRGSAPLATALLDESTEVRTAAADLLAELRELLVPGPEFGAALRAASASADARARAAGVANLWRHRLLTATDAQGYLVDDDESVRSEAVHALVSLGADEALDGAAGDASPLVRATVARGLGTLGDPRSTVTLTVLVDDLEPEVIVAAFTALAATGCPPPAAGRAAACLPGPAGEGHPNWRVREAAATALSAADARVATDSLLGAAGDTNLDVRKAAVRSLAQLAPAHPGVPAALRRAGEDPDADVRAYARQALTHYPEERQR